MGWAKERLIMEEERGYGSSDKVVCNNCVGNYYLKEYIHKNGNQNICDYCSSVAVSISMEKLMEPIMKGLWQEYENANDCMGYCGTEGGFIGADTYTAYDLIHEELWDEFDFQCAEMYDDVANLISDAIVWCQRDPYGNLRCDEDFYTWEMYVDSLKKAGVDSKNNVCSDDETTIYKSSDEILTRITEGIKTLNLIEEIPLNTALWRARAHNKSDIVNSAATLGVPKQQEAGCNRMNSTKISTFYGAFNKETALFEIAERKEPMRTVGIFYNQLPLKIINFSKLRHSSVPSLFDIDNIEQRMLMIFLKMFNTEISKPIKGKKEYLPTQKFTEYLKDEITDVDGVRITGLLYNSAQCVNGVCCSLFIDCKQCSDDKDQVLWLDNTSIENLKKDVSK